MSEKAVILISGGMDSCVTAAIALRSYTPYFLHIKYGQLTQNRELEAFTKIADYYKVEKRLVAELDYFKQIKGSALTDDKIEIPEGLNTSDAPVTYVPFRNASFLSAAVSWAEIIGANKIFIGATEEDSVGYPDCRMSFFESFNQMIAQGTQSKDIEIVTPVIEMKKSEIIRVGMELNAPLNLTWSCYKREDLACGKCDSCLRRLRAFTEAGLPDPVIYE